MVKLTPPLTGTYVEVNYGTVIGKFGTVVRVTVNGYGFQDAVVHLHESGDVVTVPVSCLVIHD